jgi:hypothetical protein
MIQFALTLLTTSTPAFLPPVTRYLMDSIGKDNSDELWSQIRKILIDFYVSSSLTLSNVCQPSSTSTTLSPEIGIYEKSFFSTIDLTLRPSPSRAHELSNSPHRNLEIFFPQ